MTRPIVVTEMPTVESTAVSPTNTPPPIATPVAAATAMPTTIPRAAIPSPTVTRPTFQILNSTNYMVLGNKMWHPDNSQMTKEIPIEVGSYPWSPDGQQLVGLNHDGYISILTLQTGELRVLEIITISADSIRWSPNGEYLSYLTEVKNNDQQAFQLTIYHLANKVEEKVSEPIASRDFISEVGWSKDSLMISYIHWEPSITEAAATTILKIVNIENQSIKEFSAPPPISILGGSWSPTQNQIVVYGYDTQQLGRPELGPNYAYSTIYLIDIDTNELVGPLISSSFEESEQPYYNQRPINLFISDTPWSPDGKSIIYSDKGVLCTFQIHHREETCLVEMSQLIIQTGAIGGEYPSWSSDGKWVGFVLKFDSLFCSPLAIYKLDKDKLEFTDAELGDCTVFWGTWSPKLN